MSDTYENIHGTTTTTPSTTGNAAPMGDDMLNRIVRGAHDTVDRVAAKAAPVVEQVKGSVHHASEVAHARADQISHLGDEWTQGLRSTVREHPLAALAVALAVGVVISRMSGPR
jgi:ElaB/YqjD/DUF883 family membrane-anchored ribosome-binding protein